MAFIMGYSAYILDCGPERLLENIDWYRADGYPIELIIKDCNGAVDLTGFEIIFTVNSKRNPLDISTQQFSERAVIYTDQINDKGRIKIIVNSVSTSIMKKGIYYYDIEVLDTSSYIRTIAKYKFNIIQDITKETLNGLYPGDGVYPSDGLFPSGV